MSGTPNGPSRVQRLVLYAYPAAWRAEHAEEMAAVLTARAGRGMRPGDIADLILRALSARVRALLRRVPALAVVAAVVAAWTGHKAAGQWSSLHLVLGCALTGVSLLLTITGARRRGHHGPAAGSRRARTVCAVSAAALVLPLLLLCGYLIGDGLRWWRITSVDITARSAVLQIPPGALLAVVVACTALLMAVWSLRPSSWRGPALAVAAALALDSWFAQLRDLVPPVPPGISYGFAPYAELQTSHSLNFQGLPRVLLFASLALTTLCATAPSRRHPYEVDGGPARAAD